MCTIMTISNEFYQDNRQAVRQQIRTDARYNNDGWNLLGIDPNTSSNDIQLSAMRVDAILKQIDQFFDSASTIARVFSHARAATTDNVGIAFCHGFTDYNGRVIMHNGIIDNAEGYTIDSYRLAGIPDNTVGIKEFLDRRNDKYVNAFLIDTLGGTYTVIRRYTGSLYMDDQGNYSTHSIGDICLPVPVNTVDHFDMLSEFNNYSDALDAADAEYLRNWRGYKWTK